MPARPRCDVLVVGAGLMGRWHGYEIRRVGSRVVGVVDPDRARAEALALRHRCEAYTELDDALEHSPATVVHVCAPTPSHPELVRTALERGRHALVEKPLAEDPVTTRALLHTAREAGLCLAPVHQFAFQPGVRRLLAEAAGLGPLRHLAFTACSAGATGMDDAGANRVAGEILPHALSLAHAFLPGGLDAATWSARRPATGELRALGVAGPVSIAVTVSMAGRPPRTTFELVGERGGGYADLFHGFAVIERGGTGRAWKVLRPLAVGGRTVAHAATNLGLRIVRSQPAYPGLRELVRAFHDAVAAHELLPLLEREALAVADARAAILGAAYAEA